MLTEFVRKPAIRWTLVLSAAVSVGSAVWIHLQSYDASASHTGFPPELHPVFRAAEPTVRLSEQQTACCSACATGSEMTVDNPSCDWPAMFGPNGNSVAPSERVQTDWPAAGPAERWQRPIGRGYSAPVIRDGKLIVLHRLGDEEIIEAFDAQAGTPLWAFRYPTTYHSKVEYSDGPYSTPTIDEQHVYAWGAQGTLRCLTLAGGELVWQRDTSKDFDAVANQFPIASSPLLEDGELILNVGGKSQGAGIVSLDAKTGHTLWTATDHLASYATPTAATIHGQRYLFVFTHSGLVALSPDDGRVFWTIDFRSMVKDLVNATSPLVVGNHVVVSGYAVGGMCVEVLPDGTYAERWRERRGLDSQYVNLVSDGTYIYGCSARDGTYRSIDLRTGKVRWAWGNDSIGRGAYSILIGRRAVLFGEHGKLAALDISGEEPVLRAMTTAGVLNAPCFTMPALADGRLYLRNESTLRCLELTPTK